MYMHICMYVLGNLILGQLRFGERQTTSSALTVTFAFLLTFHPILDNVNYKLICQRHILPLYQFVACICQN